MPRRIPTSRRPTLESLETRCNPSSIDPLAGFVAEPDADAPAQVYPANRLWEYTPCCDPRAQVDYFLKLQGVDGDVTANSRGDDLSSQPTPVDQQAILGTTAYKVVVDPVPSAAEDPQPSNSNAYFTNDYSLTIVGDSSGANLSAFAGQTVRLRVATVNNQGQLIVGVDDVSILSSVSAGGGLDVLIADTGGDRLAPTGKLYVATNVGVFDGAASNDPAGDAASASARVTKIVIDNNDPNTFYSHPDLYQNIWLNQPELDSIIDDLARDVASQSESRSSAELASFLAFPGFTGTVTVAAGDVNVDQFHDIITGAEVNAHVK